MYSFTSLLVMQNVIFGIFTMPAKDLMSSPCDYELSNNYSCKLPNWFAIFFQEMELVLR